MKKTYLTLLLVFIAMVYFSGCDQINDLINGGNNNSDVQEYNNAVVNVNKSLEAFIQNTQTYEATNFTGKPHDESKKVVDDFVQSGEKLKSDMDQVAKYQGGARGMLKSVNDGPCGPMDLIPDAGNGVSPGLIKSVADLISETKGEVAAIEKKYNNGEIDENTYNEALNTLKKTKTTKAANLGFGAIMGTGAAITTGLIIGAATLPAVATVTAVGVGVGAAVTWICNKVSGVKLKNGLDGEKYYLSTGVSKLGDLIPTTMMENNSDLTVCIDGYAPVCVKDFALPDKGHKMTIQIDPVKMEDAKTDGTTEVCFIDEVLPASTCDEVQFVTATPNPQDPGPGEGVTVTADIIPAVQGCDVTFSIIGTDGYSDSGTYQTDASGQASFYIPGGAEGVTDHVTIVTSNGKQYTVTYVF
jgi:hypothetical protein